MVRVFCDFDGTVCPQDVGETFFRKYTGDQAEESVKRLINGEITMQGWLKELCESIPSITWKDFNTFVDQFTVDGYFKDFIQFCKLHEVSVTILSDGLDLYVDRVLSNAGLNDIPFYANHAVIDDSNGSGKIAVSFPHTDAECNLCGNCKRNCMLHASADEDIIIYIGDGYSDRCPVQYADFVFAKRQLIKYCQVKNITYFEFNNFSDVQMKVEEIINRKRIRHRQEAAMMRREAFMQG
jgi:2-hydroxy-3-keto-5-methylthiopentenyl-1-phosphate phosphatase